MFLGFPGRSIKFRGCHGVLGGFRGLPGVFWEIRVMSGTYQWHLEIVPGGCISVHDISGFSVAFWRIQSNLEVLQVYSSESWGVSIAYRWVSRGIRGVPGVSELVQGGLGA